MIQFTCAACHGTFQNGWTDEERNAERDELFPGLQPEDTISVCDDCFKVLVGFDDDGKPFPTFAPTSDDCA